MTVHIEDNKLVLTTEPKTFHFDLPKDVSINLNHEICSIMKDFEHLAEYTIKTRLDNYCPKKNVKTIFMNMESGKTNELHKFVLDLSQRLDLRS